jgi:putative ABC transport system substrate-binding protein
MGRPREPRYAADRKAIENAAATLGRKILFLDITDEREFETAFATAKREQVGALIPLNDAFFNNHRNALVALAARHSLPTIYESREPVANGGLMSYGASIRAGYRQVGVYAGRILKGEKVGDLPVVQSARFELVINLKTAKALGFTIPHNFLVAADEVIE